MEGTFLEKLGGFLFHNIPSIILLIVLLFAWKWPVVGFAAFLVGAIVFALLFRKVVFFFEHGDFCPPDHTHCHALLCGLALGKTQKIRCIISKAKSSSRGLKFDLLICS